MSAKPNREVVVVGDKVLIKPEESDKTPSGLYLPQGVAEKEKVGGGYIVNVGPGYPMARSADQGEPWSRPSGTGEMEYVPLQARKGDYAVFLRSPAIEVEIDETKYLIVGHASILLLIRDRALGE
ncbi:MAG: co-chaperone GroES [Longimicrobiaceae bacterium]